MRTTTPPTRLLGRLAVLAVAGLIVSACSVEGLLERALGQIEGVDDVAIDFSEEGGAFSMTSEEGEVFGIEVDETGQSTIRTDEGTATTTVDGEVPTEVTDAIDLPAGFTARAVTETETEDGRGIIVQGEIQGDFAELLDALESSISARWPETQRQVMVPGQMGGVIGHDESEERGVHANLMFDEGDGEGMLQVMVINP